MRLDETAMTLLLGRNDYTVVTGGVKLFWFPREARLFLWFMRSCWMLMGSFLNRRVWMNFAALSWKAYLAMTFSRFGKSEKVSTVGSYIKWSHLYLATYFRSSLVHFFLKLSNTSVYVVSVEIVSDWKNSIAASRSRLWKCWKSASRKCLHPWCISWLGVSTLGCGYCPPGTSESEYVLVLVHQGFYWAHIGKCLLMCI